MQISGKAVCVSDNEDYVIIPLIDMGFLYGREWVGF